MCLMTPEMNEDTITDNIALMYAYIRDGKHDFILLIGICDQDLTLKI